MKNINLFKYNRILIALCFFTTLLSCKDSWDDHYEQIDTRLETDILTVLAEDENYSEFLNYLEETGVDNVLMASQAFTVWAPTNDAFAAVPTEILNDSASLKSLIENHIGRNSYTTASFENSVLIKMFNGKYIDFTKTGASVTFGGVETIDKDIVTSNGVVHKIQSALLVSDNIWSYLNDNADKFPYQMSYLQQFNEESFDEEASTPIGTNSLGQTVYDTVTKVSNSFFDVIGDLDSEENRFSFIGLTDEAYTKLYDSLEGYFTHKEADSTKAAIERVIFNNINFPLIDPDDLDGVELDTTTTGNRVAINVPSYVEDLSNGNVFEMDEYYFDPREIFYKPSRYEVENTTRREIGSTTDLSVEAVFNENASGRFTNTISLLADPDASNSNNYFQVSFNNVYSAKYNVKVKFNTVPNDNEPTKVKFELSYQLSGGFTIVSRPDPIIVEADEEGIVQIGDDYTFRVFVDDDEESIYAVKLKVIVDVSNAELALYNRRFGIDYVELVPVEEEVEETETESVE